VSTSDPVALEISVPVDVVGDRTAAVERDRIAQRALPVGLVSLTVREGRVIRYAGKSTGERIAHDSAA